MRYTQPAYGFGKKPILEFDSMIHKTVAAHVQEALMVMRTVDENKATEIAKRLSPLPCMSDVEKVLKEYFIVRYV
jgi:hypothetical protein